MMKFLKKLFRKNTSYDIHGDGFVLRHTHRWTRGGWIDHVPLEDPPTFRHTTMGIYVCECESWSCFPEENRNLLSPAAARALAKALRLSPSQEVRSGR
jgi:hypothetical protein